MFEHRLRVLYGDTDAATIVYHAAYLRYFEAARCELLRAHGLPYAEVERQGFFWPVADVQIRYRSPARYDDELAVGAEITRLGAASVTFGYRVERVNDRALICEGSVRLACVRRGGPVARIPAAMRAVLERIQRGEQPPLRRSG